MRRVSSIVALAMLSASCGAGNVALPTSSVSTGPSVSSADAELTAARSLWQAQAPDDYVVDVDDAARGSAVVAVRRGETITLQQGSEPATIDELFTTIERSIAEGAHVAVDYDQALGYPTQVVIDVDGDGMAEIDLVLSDLEAMPVVRSLDELLAARQLWEAQGLVDYRYVMRAHCTCDDGGTWEIEVRNAADVTSRALDAGAAASELSMTSLDRTFDDLEDWFRNSADLIAEGLLAVDVRMDPELGYPRWFRLEAEGIGDGPFVDRFTMVVTVDLVSPLEPEEPPAPSGDPAALAELAVAAEHWERAHLQDYTFVFTEHCECPSTSGPMVVEVHEGSFVAAYLLADGSLRSAADVRVETIDDALRLISLYVTQGKAVDVAYHPVLGYPVDAILDIDAVAVDGGLAFAISELEPTRKIGVIAGKVIAGPQCPVLADPLPPECEDHPVGDAQLAMGEAGWDDLIPLPLAADGTFVVSTPPGNYVIRADPHPGYMGTPEPTEFTMSAGEVLDLLIVYDTGMR